MRLIIAIGIVLFMILVFAILNASARADEEAERYWRERTRED